MKTSGISLGYTHPNLKKKKRGNKIHFKNKAESVSNVLNYGTILQVLTEEKLKILIILNAKGLHNSNERFCT